MGEFSSLGSWTIYSRRRCLCCCDAAAAADDDDIAAGNAAVATSCTGQQAGRLILIGTPAHGRYQYGGQPFRTLLYIRAVDRDVARHGLGWAQAHPNSVLAHPNESQPIW